MKKKNSNRPLVALHNGEFHLRQMLGPIGKLVKAQIASATTFESMKATFQDQLADKHRFEMLQQKGLETLNQPDVNQAYQKEMTELIKKVSNKRKPNFGSFKPITVRVIGYTKNQTVVEPAFDADHKLLVKLGYAVKE